MLYREILDAELDYRLGKLSEADYQETTAGLLSRAAALIDPDEAAGEAEVAALVEREIAAMRQALRSVRSVTEQVGS
jgi:hypothetical protein